DGVQVFLDALDVDTLTDDAGRADDDVIFRDVQQLCAGSGFALGVFHAVGCAGVGVARVYDDCLCDLICQMVTGDLNGRSLDAVFGIDSGSGAGDFRENDRGVALLGRSLDAAARRAGRKSLCSGYAARDDFIHEGKASLQGKPGGLVQTEHEIHILNGRTRRALAEVVEQCGDDGLRAVTVHVQGQTVAVREG